MVQNANLKKKLEKRVEMYSNFLKRIDVLDFFAPFHFGSLNKEKKVYPFASLLLLLLENGPKLQNN